MANRIISELTTGVIDAMNPDQMRECLRNAWAEEAQRETQEQREREAEEARRSEAKKGIDRFFEQKAIREGWTFKG